jgi:hypothetical protein
MKADRTLEAHMIEPLRELMTHELHLDVISEESSAGYGVADLVGAKICENKASRRRAIATEETIGHRLLVKVFLAVRTNGRTSIRSILNRVAISESTLRKSILPQLAGAGIIERFTDGYVRLVCEIPNPMKEVIAVEAKQTKWRAAILQARRYTFFANKSYVAVWNGTARLVDRSLLYRHRLGLIVVEPDSAKVLVEAPDRNPRKPEMHRYCAEFLYGRLLQQESKGQGEGRR